MRSRSWHWFPARSSDGPSASSRHTRRTQEPSPSRSTLRHMDDDNQLRRAWLRGYRQGDVELAVARATLAREQLQHELSATSARANAMQTEIAELHRRVDAFHQREQELTRALDELRDRREQIEREASNRAQQIVSEAEQRSASLRTE